MEIENFRDKLDSLLKQKGLRQVDLADMTHMTERHISRVKKGNDIPEKFLKRICNALKVDQNYFIENMNYNADYYPIPFRYASGGMGGGSYENSRKIISYVSLKKDFLLTKTNNLEALSFVRAVGDSMSPTIPPDASVLIDESQILPLNNKIYFILLNGEYFIKRLVVENGTVKGILSDNSGTIDYLGIDDNLQILGRAILQQSDL